MKIKYYFFITLFALVILSLLVVDKHYLNYGKMYYGTLNKSERYKNENVEEIKGVSSKLNILFAGDVMTDRYIRKQINEYEKIEYFVSNYLNNLAEINSTYDYVIVNLEGPITENKSKTLNDDGSYGKDLIFTFPTSTTDILKLLNIKIVSLANNHTDNFYNKGYQDTKYFLKNKDIEHFGNPYNEKNELSKKVCKNGICIVYIGYNQFTENNSVSIISAEIKRIKKEDAETDFIIVMPHWGNEYEKIANKTQDLYAKEWVDVGADLILGAHPHVIQNNETYKGKNIYYSLGNYIFDQWFSADVQNGLGLDISFKKECNSKDGDMCKKEIIINKELKVFINRNGVVYKQK